MAKKSRKNRARAKKQKSGNAGEPNLPFTLTKSLRGKFFLGQSEPLIIQDSLTAWGGLVNPDTSGVRLFIKSMSITNLSTSHLSGRIVFNGQASEPGIISDKVISANTTLSPLPIPNAELRCGEGYLDQGIEAFSHIIPPLSTISWNEEGQFIIASGGALIINLEKIGPSTENRMPEVDATQESLALARVSFGWWEEY